MIIDDKFRSTTVATTFLLEVRVTILTILNSTMNERDNYEVNKYLYPALKFSLVAS